APTAPTRSTQGTTPPPPAPTAQPRPTQLPQGTPPRPHQGQQPRQGTPTSGQRPGQKPGQPGQRPTTPTTPGQRPPSGQGTQKAPASGNVVKLSDIPPELLEQLRGRDPSTISVKEIEDRMKQPQKPQAAAGVAPIAPAPSTGGEEDDDDRRGGPRRPGAGGVAGRADRHKERAERQAKRKTQGDERGGGGKITLDMDDNPRYRKSRGHREKLKRQGTVARKGKIPVTLPITVRSLSEAMGRKSAELITWLMNHGAGLIHINSAIDPDTAELMALEFGCELEIKRAADAEEKMTAAAEEQDDP